ncbi:MAG: AarF/ABC1/UbiB kinase family protein [Candidatus Hydrogenedentes bacterium]|nr:AarF/ABC1/UbiB kinase family protein [Candidatus Hydrogenedentota bacterium]
MFVKHGFADLVRRSGFHDRLPARMLRGLNLMSAPSGEPATFGQRACAALTELGPTFVKFGQILSTRTDLIRPDIARELSQLQDNVAPSPFNVMAEVVEESLEAPIGELFAELQETPVASASLSQVYEARLKSGERVAVKVQRPGTEKTIESDLNLMRQLAEWMDGRVFEGQWMDPVGVVDEFQRSIQRELDFTIEARIIEQFRHNFEGIEHVFIPKVYSEYSRKRVLTMDWVDGVRVDQLTAYAERNCDPRHVALLGCEVVCKMVFEHHLFHADPHPGNIFIMRDNRLAFLDLGMAGHLERVDVAAIADLLYAMFQRDAVDCVDALMTVTAKGVPDNRELLEHEIAEFIAFEAQAIVGGGHVAKGIERATQILRRFNLQLAPRFALLLKALATIELVGRKLYPALDMVPIMTWCRSCSLMSSA